MKDYACIIWDWNGTLADDVYASLQSVNDILNRRGLPPINMEQYHAYIDTPIRRFYEHILDLNQVSMDTIAEEFQAGYIQYFDRLHTGAEVLLEKLKRGGVRQVILTSGHQQVIERDTRRFGVRDYFEEVLGADDLMATGKVERGITWMRGQSVPPEQMVLIGDSLHDYETAKAMGVDCILCAIGHQSETDLRTAGVPVVREFGALAELVCPNFRQNID